LCNSSLHVYVNSLLNHLHLRTNLFSMYAISVTFKWWYLGMFADNRNVANCCIGNCCNWSVILQGIWLKILQSNHKCTKYVNNLHYQKCTKYVNNLHYQKKRKTLGYLLSSLCYEHWSLNKITFLQWFFYIFQYQGSAKSTFKCNNKVTIK